MLGTASPEDAAKRVQMPSVRRGEGDDDEKESEQEGPQGHPVGAGPNALDRPARRAPALDLGNAVGVAGAAVDDHGASLGRCAHSSFLGLRG